VQWVNEKRVCVTKIIIIVVFLSRKYIPEKQLLGNAIIAFISSQNNMINNLYKMIDE